MQSVALVLRSFAIAVLVWTAIAATNATAAPYPILFVTQTPNGHDFANLMSTFGTHRGDTESAPRGGDLWIRYPDGSRRNLTAEAGYGLPGHEIAVRDPAPHASGTRALFSMVIGGTTQDDYTPAYFQIYEVTGLWPGQTVSIRKLPQPPDYDNVSPIYGAGDRVFFTSDRPRNGDRRLHPQLDEYETAPTVSGLWSMHADGTDLVLLDHSPSGVFEPLVDSFGRIVFARWDHLQRDQQGDSDIGDLIDGQQPGYGAITYDSETSDVHHQIAPGDEVFPEQRGLYGGSTPNPVWDQMLPTETGHTFNHFFPWMIEQDGTGLEILNHLGRHELAGYIAPGRTYLDYDGVEERVDIFLHISEDPTRPGTFLGIQCPEFGTRSAGQIVSIAAPPGANADTLSIDYVTHRATGSVLDDGEPPTANHIGMFRDPVVLSDSTLWASHTTNVYYEDETVSNPPYPQPFTLSSRNDFAIKRLVPSGNHHVVAERLLATPIVESISYFDNDRYRVVSYAGPLWELQPIELRPQAEPMAASGPLPAIEASLLADELGAAGLATLRSWLREHELALITSRDVTVRADRQQDFNLAVAWSAHQTAAPGSTPKQLGWLQLFEGQQLRGFDSFNDGRRVLARTISAALNPPEVGAPAGAVRLGDDGSMAAFVPARRALTWQTTEANGTPSVRERYWLTFQPGEIRVCTNCHGVNTTDVFGGPIPQNEPAALRELVAWWRDEVLPVPEPEPLGAAAAVGVALAALARRRERITPWSSASRRSRG